MYFFRFGISRGGRCLIADEMGLGKTIQALGIAHYYKDSWPLLIVCPSSIKFTWKTELIKFLPSVEASSVLVVTTSRDVVNKANVVITSYDLMKSILPELLEINFGVQIYVSNR